MNKSPYNSIATDELGGVIQYYRDDDGKIIAYQGYINKGWRLVISENTISIRPDKRSKKPKEYDYLLGRSR